MEPGGSLKHSQESTTCPYPSKISPFLCPSHFWQVQLVSFLVGLRTYQHPGITGTRNDWKKMEAKILRMNFALKLFVRVVSIFFAVLSNILTSPVSFDALVDFVPRLIPLFWLRYMKANCDLSFVYLSQRNVVSVLLWRLRCFYWCIQKTQKDCPSPIRGILPLSCIDRCL